MRGLATACLALLPLTAFASEFPALFDVTGVASDDTLNIRAQPSAGSDKAGAFAHDARNVEVVGLDDSRKWARVSLPERSGWVAMRYLQRQSPDPWTHDQVPLACFGTEPFWSADLSADRTALSFQFFDDPAQHYQVTWVKTPENYVGGILGLGAQGNEGGAFATISSTLCSDGMSDRDFGLSIALFLHTNDQDQVVGYRGCCSLQSR